MIRFNRSKRALEIYPWSEAAKALREMPVKIRERQPISEGSLLRTSEKNYKCMPLKLLLGYDEGRRKEKCRKHLDHQKLILS